MKRLVECVVVKGERMVYGCYCAGLIRFGLASSTQNQLQWIRVRKTRPTHEQQASTIIRGAAVDDRKNCEFHRKLLLKSVLKEEGLRVDG
jgi:hypothetical protein